MVICLERGATDLHMVQLMPLPPHHLAPVKSRMVYLSGDGLPRLSWKMDVVVVVCCSTVLLIGECVLVPC